MNKKKSKSEDFLNNFFESSRYTIPDLKSDLKERILEDAGKINPSYNSIQIPFRLNDKLKNINGYAVFSSITGLAACLVLGFYIGFTSPDWSEPVATVLKINQIDKIDITDPFFGLESILEDI